MAASVQVAFKTLFIVLACIMAAAVVYTYAMDGSSSCYDPSGWWIQAAETDFFVFMIPVVAWYIYKESSWIRRVVLIFITFWCGSFGTCGYIALQFFKLSPEESLKDPLYFVLARRQTRDVIIRPSVARTAKVIVIAIGCYMTGFVIYAYCIDGFPFHIELLTPCMITSLTDISIHTLVFSMWIAYKEPSWISALFWILILACFSGIGLCVYILRELFHLSPEQPISLILFNKSNRDIISSDPLLMEHSDV